MMPRKVFFYMSGTLHNAYRQMLANTPEGFEYTSSENMAISSSPGGGRPSSILKALQPTLSPLYNRLLIYANSPKCRKFSVPGYDLVHSCQSLLETPLPYVADFEHAAVFSGFNQFAFRRKGFLKALERKLLDKKLKKLISWSDATRGSLLNFIKNEEIAQKTETVYAVVTPPEKLERIKHEGVNFLFVGKVFYEKGGYDSILAFDHISSKYDASLTVVSPVPQELKDKFSRNGKIKFLEGIPFSSLKKLYLESDALVFPTHYDTYGYVIPEAFSYGLPVICDNSFCRPELVKDGKTGLIVQNSYSSFNPDFSYRHNSIEEMYKRKEDCMHPSSEYIGKLSNAMETLIVDGSLRDALSSNARKETTEGRFSPAVWKKKMEKIYLEALE